MDATAGSVKPMDGTVYGIGFIDNDPTRTDARMLAARRAMDNTLRQFPGAKWRDEPHIERVDGKVTIRARLALAGT